MKSHGYIAISSVLVISAVLLIIGTSVALLSVNDIQSALSNVKSEDTLHLVDGCIEDVLLRLNETNAIPPTITIPEGSCSVTINSQVGTTSTFTTTASIGSYTKSVQVTAIRGTSIIINNWTQQ